VSARASLDPLTALRVDYAERLPARVRRIARALRASRRAPGDAELRERARVLAHRLRGTAGSYGLPAVGAAAGRIEDALGRSSWDEIEAALRDAEALAGSAVGHVLGVEVEA
jgi:HPt (histidine-containing phosphotransfer) domain-containing protein